MKTLDKVREDIIRERDKRLGDNQTPVKLGDSRKIALRALSTELSKGGKTISIADIVRYAVDHLFKSLGIVIK